MDIISRTEAKSLGLRRYFTGNPCIRNHLCERTMGGDCFECLRAKRPEKRGRDADTRRSHYLRNKHSINAANKRFRDKDRVERPWKYLMHGAETRAKVRRIEFLLTEEWAIVNWTGSCVLTGIPFDLAFTGKSGPRPFSPSIDRIDQLEGYTPGNCRFILMCVNGFRATLSDEEMRKVAQAIVG